MSRKIKRGDQIQVSVKGVISTITVDLVEPGKNGGVYDTVGKYYTIRQIVR